MKKEFTKKQGNEGVKLQKISKQNHNKVGNRDIFSQKLQKF